MAAAMEEAHRAGCGCASRRSPRAPKPPSASAIEIIASLTSGLLVVGNDRRVQSLNPSGRRLLRLPDADWTGDVTDVLRTRAAARRRRSRSASTAGHPVRRRTVPHRRRSDAHDASRRHRARRSPTRRASHGAICLFTDLTDVVELEEQLRLKDSLAQVGELTAGIAHEFRNGLATIHGYARLLDLDAAAGRRASLRPGHPRRDRRARRGRAATS